MMVDMETLTLTDQIPLPTHFIMEFWWPGSNPEYRWSDLMDDLRQEGILLSNAGHHDRTGMDGVVLRGDGTVLSGADVVISAYVKGASTVGCSFMLEKA